MGVEKVIKFFQNERVLKTNKFVFAITGFVAGGIVIISEQFFPLPTDPFFAIIQGGIIGGICGYLFITLR